MQRRVSEMQECKFQPDIIGFNYDNSGLPSKLKLKIKKPGPPEGQQKKVEERCSDGNDRKMKERIQKQITSKHKMEQECTFKPLISSKPLYKPPMPREEDLAANLGIEHHPDKHDFQARNERWMRAQEIKRIQLKQQQEQDEREQNTFHPIITKMSQEIHQRKIECIKQQVVELQEMDPQEAQGIKIQSYYNMSRGRASSQLEQTRDQSIGHRAKRSRTPQLIAVSQNQELFAANAT